MSGYENSRRQVHTIAVVAMILTAFCCGSIIMDEAEETEAVVVIDDILILVVINAILTGYIIGEYLVNHYNGGSGTEDSIVRGYEAQAVAESILNNILIYKNNMENNQQIWRLTNEHHIRQAELAASEIWQPDREFDAGDILELSGVYLNSAYALDNGASQINAMFEMVSETLDTWNATDTYKDKMEVEVDWGTGSLSTKSELLMHLGVSSPNVQDGADRVYLTNESTIWADKASVVTSSEGKSINLSYGLNDLSTIDGFVDGEYELQSGVSYCGDMMSVLDADAAPLYSGLVIGTEDESKFIYYTDDGIVIDGSRGSSLTVTIHPTGAGSTESVDIMPMLEGYSGMLDAVYWTMSNAASSAAAVWSIYDSAGQASAYLSTLMIPDIYEGIEVTSAQKSVMTILAMEQLSQYWQDNGEKLKIDDYNMSDSLSLFARGDIVDTTGETVYENVIFTPFFYQDTSLKTGNNQVQRQAIIAVWGSGENLSSWDGITNASKAMLLTAESGYALTIYEMKNQGKMVNSVDLTVSKISIIDPEKLVHDPLDPVPGNDLDRIIMLVMVIFGALMLMSGWRSGNYVVLLIGLLMIAAGLLFSGSIAGALENWFGWRIDLG